MRLLQHKDKCGYNMTMTWTSTSQQNGN